MNSKGKKKGTYQIVNKNVANFIENDDSDDCESELTDEEGLNYYLESSESETEVECDTWDSDCKVLPKMNVPSITGYHLMPTCSRDPDSQPRKRQKIAPEINPALQSQSLLVDFRENYLKNNSLSSDNLKLIVDPFKVCVTSNFLANASLLDDIRQEIYELDWNSRCMDLYEFSQSKDLKYLSSEHLKSMFEFLKTDVMKWVTELTGLDLSLISRLSATCSIYTNTDYLLVHDDQREDRLIAFILYLTDNWDERKGGALQLYDKDEDGQPRTVVKSIFPGNNQFVFFPVTNDSYHQVAEIMSMNDYRLSINGWFHTKTPMVFEPLPFKIPSEGLYSKNLTKAKEVDIDLESWINEDYLEIKATKLIQRHIEENSEISLRRFFRKESFTEVLETLKNEDIQWIKIGPPNRYSYEIIDVTKLPHSIDRFLSLFQSTAMFHLLQKYTDLELTKPKASMKFELQRWTPGCYSLLTEYNWQEKNELDLIMYFGCTKSSDVVGARTQYVTIEDEIQNALITLEPEQNNLNVVYRDSARFTKYFSKQSKCQCFYTLVCSYSE